MVAAFDLIFGNQHQGMGPNYCAKFGNGTNFQSSLSATTRKEGGDKANFD